jgi:AraC-like DNA-binding protein
LNINLVVVKASHLQPFITFLDSVNAPVDQWLTEVNLQRELFSHPDNLVAEAPFWAFLGLAANHKGLADIGFQVTERLSLNSFGVFGVNVMQADTLHKALTLFIADMGQQSNCPAFWLEEQAQGFWFYRLGTQGIKKGQWPIEQHVVSMMIQLARGFTSKQWTPPAVHLQTHTLKGAKNPPSFKNSKVIISKPYTGIFIPQAILLNKPLGQEGLNSKKVHLKQKNISGVNSQVLKVIIAQSNYKVTYSAEHAAKSLGVSVRQMQRLLKYEKTSFRELTEQVLLKQAQLMLAEESMSILDIAFELGYTDAGNFTRAFKRWSGVSPSQYKEHLTYHS